MKTLDGFNKEMGHAISSISFCCLNNEMLIFKISILTKLKIVIFYNDLCLSRLNANGGKLECTILYM